MDDPAQLNFLLRLAFATI